MRPQSCAYSKRIVEYFILAGLSNTFSRVKNISRNWSQNVLNAVILVAMTLYTGEAWIFDEHFATRSVLIWMRQGTMNLFCMNCVFFIYPVLHSVYFPPDMIRLPCALRPPFGRVPFWYIFLHMFLEMHTLGSYSWRCFFIFDFNRCSWMFTDSRRFS